MYSSEKARSGAVNIIVMAWIVMYQMEGLCCLLVWRESGYGKCGREQRECAGEETSFGAKL